MDARQDSWPTEFLREALDLMKLWLADCTNGATATTAYRYWKALTSKAKNQLEQLEMTDKAKNEMKEPEGAGAGTNEKRRAKRWLSIAVVAALYNQVEKSRTIPLHQRRDGEEVWKLSSNSDLTNRKAAELLGELAALLTKYG